MSSTDAASSQAEAEKAMQESQDAAAAPGKEAQEAAEQAAPHPDVPATTPDSASTDSGGETWEDWAPDNGWNSSTDGGPTDTDNHDAGGNADAGN